jgi:hypothetical protein
MGSANIPLEILEALGRTGPAALGFLPTKMFVGRLSHGILSLLAWVLPVDYSVDKLSDTFRRLKG